VSETTTPDPVATASLPVPHTRPSFTRYFPKILFWLVGLSLLAVLALYAARAYRLLASSGSGIVPTAKVQRGDLSLTITARGELRGQHPQVLTAPMTGGGELHITSLLRSGIPVHKGDVVVQFDTAEQEYKLKEAEADLAEAEQHILQVKAQQEATDEEDRYALLKAQTDVTLAELDVRKNPLVAAITARQNDLALSAARDRQTQLQRNLTNRQATSQAAAAIQEAGKAKAQAQARTAKENIDAMTLRATRDGYVSVDQNANVQFVFFGMTLPPFQTGDAVRPGMAVAEIPDLQNWEIDATIGELDRGHIAVGEPANVEIVAVSDLRFTGHIKDVGGVAGPPWDRKFSCKLGLDNPSPRLRPGMSARLVITTDRLQNALWLPAQALFESDGRTFVYANSAHGFVPKDVKLIRRNETRVVISGLAPGQEVALANPLDIAKKAPNASKGPIPRS